MDEAKRAGLCFMCLGKTTLHGGHYDSLFETWVETPKKCQYCRGTGRDINKQVDYARVSEEVKALSFSGLVREGARLYFISSTRDADGQYLVRTFEESHKCESIKWRLQQEFGVDRHAIWLWFRRLWRARLITNCTPPNAEPIQSGYFKGYYDNGVVLWYQALKKALNGTLSKKSRLKKEQRANIVMSPRVQACEAILMKMNVGHSKYLYDFNRLKV
jgi:hypothetical protein